ncbi:MAG: DHA2 family efflux MFS transporter permease subunit [Microbacteriaceae bacterium]
MNQPAIDTSTFGSPKRWLALVSISLAVAIIIADSTIVSVAVPSIVDDLGLTSSEVQWIQESYTLVFAAFLLAFGTLADRIGRRRMLVIGTVVFTAASVWAGLSQSGTELIWARLLQGLGGAAMLPTTLSLINANYTGKARGIAFAIWGSTIGGMAAVGPLLGGWLTTDFSWHWAFGINVPIGIVIVAALFAFVPESRNPANALPDLVGALLSVLTFAPLVFGLIEGRTLGWWLVDQQFSIGDWNWSLDVSPVPFAFGLAVLAGVAFVWWCRVRFNAGKPSMIAFDLLSISSFRNGNVAALIVSLGEFGIIFSLPLWLQNAMGYDALQTGWVLMALAIGSFVASGMVGGMSGKIAPILMVRIGIVLEIVGLVLLGLVIGVDTPWFGTAGGLFVYGMGVGLATAQLTGVVLQDVPITRSGQGSATQSTARQIGSALGIAILGTILFSALGGLFGANLDNLGAGAEQRDEIVQVVVNSAGSAIPQLEAQLTPTVGPDAAAKIQADAEQSLATATQYGAFAAAGFLVIGLLATLSLGGARKPAHSVDP